MKDKKTTNPSPRPPQDFAGVLKSEIPLFLVGGQAVNLWALYYFEYTSDLSPFVSRDADILGNLLKIITSTKAVKIFEKLNISSLHIFSELKADPSSKLYSFITKRLPRILPKLQK